jgi:AcrR family transcriptional regulator
MFPVLVKNPLGGHSTCGAGAGLGSSAPRGSRSLMPRTIAPAALKRRWLTAETDQRRDLIIHAALDLLYARGLHAVTMRRVAQRLGVGAMTLYTYVNGQEGLRREMIRRGFEKLNEGCRSDTPENERCVFVTGARAYLRFAVENPNLYNLMFATPHGDTVREALRGGFDPLLAEVRARCAQNGLTGEALEREAVASAGRFWIALHGLASLAIAQRLGVLGGNPEALLDDLLERVKPK